MLPAYAPVQRLLCGDLYVRLSVAPQAAAMTTPGAPCYRLPPGRRRRGLGGRRARPPAGPGRPRRVLAAARARRAARRAQRRQGGAFAGRCPTRAVAAIETPLPALCRCRRSRWRASCASRVFQMTYPCPPTRSPRRGSRCCWSCCPASATSQCCARCCPSPSLRSVPPCLQLHLSPHDCCIASYQRACNKNNQINFKSTSKGQVDEGVGSRVLCCRLLGASAPWLVRGGGGAGCRGKTGLQLRAGLQSANELWAATRDCRSAC